MAETNALDLAGRLRLASYRVACLVHWPPRERAIEEALEQLVAPADRSASRILDIGCGPGPLVPLARRLGMDYLGVDTDPAMIEYARATFGGPDCMFETTVAAKNSLPVEGHDIVVLNGVAHHLPDELFTNVLGQASRARFLLICDHWREPGKVRWISRQLQAHDQGKYIRDFSSFATLPGFTAAGVRVFSIGVAGIELWPYFCAAYRARATGMRGEAT